MKAKTVEHRRADHPWRHIAPMEEDRMRLEEFMKPVGFNVLYF